ncbi:MAG: hypothetical protein ACLRSW_12850 [Christensenellaceae bacterium]
MGQGREKACPIRRQRQRRRGQRNRNFADGGRKQLRPGCLVAENLYGTIEISDKALRASANSEGAFVSLLNGGCGRW